MRQTVHAYFQGAVQGVGFRFTAKRVASRHTILGWVKNLPDGRVELYAQGLPQDLMGFFDDLTAEFHDSIHNWSKEEIDPPERYRGFEVRM